MKKLNDRQFDTLFEAMNQLNPGMISETSVSGNKERGQKPHPARRAVLKWVIVAAAAVTVIASLFAVFILNDIAHHLWGQPVNTGASTEQMTSSPVITTSPVTTVEPGTTEEPITTKEPVTTDSPVITEKEEEPLITSGAFAFEKTEDGTGWIVYGNKTADIPENLVIPASFRGLPVKEIGAEAFDGLDTLQTVVIPDTVTKIGDGAFHWCNNLAVPEFPSGLSYIGDGAFFTAQITMRREVVLPDSVTHVGKNAFAMNHAILTKVTFSKNLKTLDVSAFPLVWLKVPEWTEVVTGAVSDENVAVSFLSPTVKIENLTGSFDVYGYPGSTAEQYAKKCGLKFFSFDEVGLSADEIELIPHSSSDNIQVFFRSDTGELRINGNGTVLWEGGPGLGRLFGITEYYSLLPLFHKIVLGEGIENVHHDMGHYMVNLEEVELPSTVKTIETLAFCGCKNLKTVNIPASVTTIEEEAFIECESLCVTVPKSVTEIGLNAFGGVGEIRVEEGNPRYKAVGNCLIDMQEKAVISVGKNGVIPDDGSVTQILGASGVEELHVPASIESIGDKAAWGGSPFVDQGWHWDTALKKLTFAPNSRLKSIGDYAFARTQLTEVQLPESLETIGDSSFVCFTLNELKIPARVKSIGAMDWGFYFGNNIEKHIYFLSSNTEISGTWEVFIGEGTVVIHGYAGSTAEKFAEQNGFAFFVLPYTPEEPSLVALDCEDLLPGYECTIDREKGELRIGGTGNCESMGYTVSVRIAIGFTGNIHTKSNRWCLKKESQRFRLLSVID